MELTAVDVSVQGSHGPVLEPTSVPAESGAVSVITGYPGPGQVALSRALAGRLDPTRVLGIAQVVVAFLVVWLGLGIQVERPVAAIGFLMLVSMTFIAIVHMLVSGSGSIGKFLGLVLMVVQLVSAGGTFPYQTLPGPLRTLHDVLPMSYAVDGMRQTLYGGPNGTQARDVPVLVGFAVAALLLTSLAALRQRVWSVKKLVPELSI